MGGNQWFADMLDYQTQLGPSWITLFGWPVYKPWKLFDWWYHYEAYAPHVFNKAGMLAATSGFMGCAAAVVGALWRGRQSRLVTTCGSSRWATTNEMRQADCSLRQAFSSGSETMPISAITRAYSADEGVGRDRDKIL